MVNIMIMMTFQTTTSSRIIQKIISTRVHFILKHDLPLPPTLEIERVVNEFFTVMRTLLLIPSTNAQQSLPNNSIDFVLHELDLRKKIGGNFINQIKAFPPHPNCLSQKLMMPHGQGGRMQITLVTKYISKIMCLTLKGKILTLQETIITGNLKRYDFRRYKHMFPCIPNFRIKKTINGKQVDYWCSNNGVIFSI